MLMQMIDCLIEQDPSLSARRTIDVRRYIVNRWNRTHEESIDEDGVALFLCDENRGTLTDEQRIFARECREEIKACYRNAVFQISVRRNDAPASGVRPGGILPDLSVAVRRPLQQAVFPE
jgi:hypothetical protein